MRTQDLLSQVDWYLLTIVDVLERHSNLNLKIWTFLFTTLSITTPKEPKHIIILGELIFEALLTILIILLSLFGVGECFIRIIDLGEPFIRLGVLLVSIWVVLLREGSECLLDVLLGGGLRYTQCLVEVTVFLCLTHPKQHV